MTKIRIFEIMEVQEDTMEVEVQEETVLPNLTKPTKGPTQC